LGIDGPNIVLLALPEANYRHFHFHTAVRPSSSSSTSLGVGAQPMIGRTARERRHGAAFDDTDNQLGVALCRSQPPRGRRLRTAPPEQSAMCAVMGTWRSR
jgi:hypothetical protein